MLWRGWCDAHAPCSIKIDWWKEGGYNPGILSTSCGHPEPPKIRDIVKGTKDKLIDSSRAVQRTNSSIAQGPFYGVLGHRSSWRASYQSIGCSS